MRKNLPVTILKVTSKKCAAKRLFSMVIDGPSFLNKAMMFFLILCGADPPLLLKLFILFSLNSAQYLSKKNEAD